MKIIKFKKRAKQLVIMACLLTSSFASASGGGGSGIANKISSWGSTISTSLNAAVGVFAIVGGFLIFIQYMQGNDQAQKNFIKFVIGLAVFGLAALIVNVFV
ncbi:DUF4134 domain-containing protein [Aquimarina sp. RZ0]|uniref:DUF4134 domain-containing protein n=1 Tax=Aquimarina sp. RZ0 TaxID=2607730 RepID=UPI0011F1D71C|nr:DUF4134 domain-containing protein [Aquimarina sp. RZ0]KAA1246742.1 DUF4134 domain-containing protein [Aquimarina sp. RZ0]